MARQIVSGIFDGNCRGKRVAVICGSGNNGGDGFVTGRHLVQSGANVRIYVVGTLDTLKVDAKVHAGRAVEAGIDPFLIGDRDDVPSLTDNDLIVDALFGTGFHGPVTGVAVRVIEAINSSRVPVAAVDTPSGLDSDSGAVNAPTVNASYTYALAASKRGHWLWPGRGCVGELQTIDIGIPAESYASLELKLRLITPEFVRIALPERLPDGHKGTFGKSLIIGGSAGMSGAVVLASCACMRMGVGLTYAAVPASLVDIVDAGTVETVVRPLPEVSSRRVIARRALGVVQQLWTDVDAIAIGPGLSLHHETQELVRRLVQKRTRPTVLDADGLNACAKEVSCFDSGRDVPLILTPHAGEMARLLNCEVEDVTSDRQRAATDAARRFGCIVVMKGAPTFVADPDGQVFLNPTGNSGMATGGTGDVLTGIIVSLLAQGCQPLVAALCGVFLHGLAGDEAAAEMGERSLVATDLVEAIPLAIQSLEW